jgi:murein DD-endopeptidase MepM/ murein hydrolase activator NlpD
LACCILALFVFPATGNASNNHPYFAFPDSHLAQSVKTTDLQMNTCTDTDPIGLGSSRAQMFMDAYNRKGGRANMGCTINGTHWWGDGSSRSVVIQDFRGGPAGNIAIIHDENRDQPMNSTPAYVIQGGIWDYYIQLGGWNSWLGPPTSDEFENETGQAQNNFKNGYIAWDNGSPIAVAWPTAISQQWYAEYHNGRNLNNYPTWARNETSIDYDWVSGAPGNSHWGVWSDNFSVRWTGSFMFTSGTYVFNASVDDSIRIWVDGEMIIDQWIIQPGNFQAVRTLSAGIHTVRVEFYEEARGARIRVWWNSINNPPPQASLVGYVTDTRTGAAIEGSTVSIGSRVYSTDKNGKYQFNDIYPGDYQISATKSNYGSYQSNIHINSGNNTQNINLTARSTGLTLPLKSMISNGFGYVNAYYDTEPRSGYISDYFHPKGSKVQIGGKNYTSPWTSIWQLGLAYDGHNGVDFNGVLKTSDVVAAYDGYIEQYRDNDPDYNRNLLGNYIKMRHTDVKGRQIYTYYWHLERGTIPPEIKNAIAHKTLIPRGTVLGKVGMSGNTSGPYVHFGVSTTLSGSANVDPYTDHLWANASTTTWYEHNSHPCRVACG